MNGVIFLAGVYGVGKSTLGKAISEIAGLPFYSAGDLISEQIGEVYGANKRVYNKKNNQDILIECINKKIVKEATILLAGHFCILGNHKPEKLPAYVYEKMGINLIILLEARPYEIIKHLQKRDNKKYSLETIKKFIAVERNYAIKISKKYNIPLKIHSMNYTNRDITAIINFLEEISDENITRY